MTLELGAEARALLSLAWGRPLEGWALFFSGRLLGSGTLAPQPASAACAFIGCRIVATDRQAVLQGGRCQAARGSAAMAGML